MDDVTRGSLSSPFVKGVVLFTIYNCGGDLSTELVTVKCLLMGDASWLDGSLPSFFTRKNCTGLPSAGNGELLGDATLLLYVAAAGTVM